MNRDEVLITLLLIMIVMVSAIVVMVLFLQVEYWVQVGAHALQEHGGQCLS